jgi:glycosyltransferase involved in cell wall biosynthesis
VIGSGASDTLRTLAAAHPGTVALEGYVADLEPVFSRATVALAPMRMGSGIKLKMLDAFARGVPVLATSIAIDGIPVARDGSDGCLICDDVSQWPRLIAELADPRRAAEMSAAALDFFARTYGRDVVGAQYDEIFGLVDPAVELPMPRSPSHAVAGRPVTRSASNVS